MRSPRLFAAMSVCEVYVVAIYVLVRFADTDLGSSAGVWRVLLVVAAACVAGVSYHLWSTGPTTRTTCAMVLGLLGGAALASTVISADDERIYSSAALAAVGTAGVVAAVVITQISHARTQVDAS
ncbi:MAG: hypothetical protein JWP31_1632 [Aeromicrobium sp.]|nr:hypothetical protein [Aeromicrobium sp.]